MFSKAERHARACLRAARVMREFWEEKGSSDTRLLLEPLVPEELVLVGESLNGFEHKEHVVPSLVICQLYHEIFECGGNEPTSSTGAAFPAVAQHLNKHLATDLCVFTAVKTATPVWPC